MFQAVFDRFLIVKDPPFECRDCRFFEVNNPDEDVGLCRRRAPTGIRSQRDMDPMGAGSRGDSERIFPLVLADFDWCGDGRQASRRVLRLRLRRFKWERDRKAAAKAGRQDSSGLLP